MKLVDPHKLRWLTLIFAVIFLVLAAAGFTLQGLTGSEFAQMSLSVQIPFYLLMGVWALIATLIVWFHPRNPVGWLIVILVPIVALDQITFGYVAYDASSPAASLPGVNVALIWLKWMGMPFGILVLTLELLLFPNGRFLSRQWRLLAWVTIATILAYLVLKPFEPGPISSYRSAVSPLAVSDSRWAILNPLLWITMALMILCMCAALYSLILRLRQARSVERQQIKWLVAPSFLFIVGVPIVVLGQYEATGNLFMAGGFLHMIAVTGILSAMAIGIFKYRLYDIDIIVNRTLVYSLLTLLLAAIYFSSVVLMEQLFRFLTGQESPLTVVVSTLLIAGLFNPLRRRVKAFIDRRFYRRKYDAVKTLAASSRAARDEVDLDVLTAELMNVVESVMQPEKLSLWIRDPGRS